MRWTRGEFSFWGGAAPWANYLLRLAACRRTSVPLSGQRVNALQTELEQAYKEREALIESLRLRATWRKVRLTLPCRLIRGDVVDCIRRRGRIASFR